METVWVGFRPVRVPVVQAISIKCLCLLRQAFHQQHHKTVFHTRQIIHWAAQNIYVRFVGIELAVNIMEFTGKWAMRYKYFQYFNWLNFNFNQFKF